MEPGHQDAANIRRAVPFVGITGIEAPLRFYVTELGFTMTHQWRRKDASDGAGSNGAAPR